MVNLQNTRKLISVVFGKSKVFLSRNCFTIYSFLCHFQPVFRKLRCFYCLFLRVKLTRVTGRRLSAVLSRSISRRITADHKGRGICNRDCALREPIFPSELTIIVNLERIACWRGYRVVLAKKILKLGHLILFLTEHCVTWSQTRRYITLFFFYRKQSLVLNVFTKI